MLSVSNDGAMFANSKFVVAMCSDVGTKDVFRYDGFPEITKLDVDNDSALSVRLDGTSLPADDAKLKCRFDTSVLVDAQRTGDHSLRCSVPNVQSLSRQYVVSISPNGGRHWTLSKQFSVADGGDALSNDTNLRKSKPRR